MINNILKKQCPRCRQGKLFVSAPYNLKSFAKMHERCPCCDLKYEQEPGFFYGALYVSYALQVAIFATISVALAVLVPDAPLSWYLIGVTGAAFMLFPLVIRISRSIWIHIFVKYDEAIARKVTEGKNE
ncbi:MAG: DUF983 domain-containing protein [Ekhidna sp.]|nr:DUF983 domain-containing protein [Ekhidna sp.]